MNKEELESVIKTVRNLSKVDKVKPQQWKILIEYLESKLTNQPTAPSVTDEEINDTAWEWSDYTGDYGFKHGAKWMRDKLQAPKQSDNSELLEFVFKVSLCFQGITEPSECEPILRHFQKQANELINQLNQNK